MNKGKKHYEGEPEEIHGINKRVGNYHMLFDIFSMDDLVEGRPGVFSLRVFLLHGISVKTEKKAQKGDIDECFGLGRGWKSFLQVRLN